VAISPDVVSFVRERIGYCDLRRRGGIANVAREASSMSLTTGTARKVACFGAPEMMEAPAPQPVRRGL